MKWTGKAAALLLLLLLTRGRINQDMEAIAIGIGHLYDMGVFTGGYRAKPERPPPAAAPSSEDPYEVLGVAPRSNDEELEQAYRRRMSEYHPDRVANAAKEIRELANQRAREINEAYDRIKRERGIP
jgi:DnaJ-domain-containing protein 1